MLPPFPEAQAALQSPPRVAVVITNHNYATFLAAAIESALGQRHADVAVVVVDDGSTDRSRNVIAGYGGRISAVLQDRQGQKAAFNAGLAAVSADVVLFLDADDLLHPDTAAAVARGFVAEPAAARAVFRLEAVDASGRRLGHLVPSAQVPLARGDVRRQVLDFGDDLAWPPTSGNAFATWVLRRVMPLPLDDDPTGADLYLHALTPLFGPVIELPGVGGAYRMHGGNAHHRERFDVARSRVILERARRAHAALDRTARELGYGAARPRSVTLVAHRLVSVRLAPEQHPIPNDRRWEALAAGFAAAFGRRDVSIRVRGLYGVWLCLAALAPVRWVPLLADLFFLPERRGRALRWLNRRPAPAPLGSR
jgi:hypothetical protein